MSNNLTYRAPLSKTVRIMTCITNIILLAIFIAFILMGYLQIRSGDIMGWILIATAIISPLASTAALWAPKSYRIGDSEIYVHKIIGDEKLPIDNIRSIELWDYRDVFRYAIRVFGSGGYYGAFGSFAGGKLSSFKALVTNDGTLIVLRMKKGEPVVISPENPSEFASELCEKSGVSVQENMASAVEEAASYRPPFTRGLKVLEFLALALLFTAIVEVTYFWHKLPQTIPTHFGITGVPDRYGPKNTIWILPAVALVIYLLLTVIAVFLPKINSSRGRKSVALLRWVFGMCKCFILGITAYITWKTILTALGSAQGLGIGFTIAMLLIVFIGDPILLIIAAIYASQSSEST